MAEDDKNLASHEWEKNPMGPAFEGAGITPEYLAKKIKSELNATTSTEKAYTYKDGKTLKVKSKTKHWDIRQKARQDAHKLMGDYPAEKHEVQVTERKLVKI